MVRSNVSMIHSVVKFEKICLNATPNRILPLWTVKASNPQKKPIAIVDLTREKNIKGRKRHLVVDTNGFVLRVLVSAADISDGEGGIWLFLNHPHVFPNVQTLRVDQGYKEHFVEWVSQELNWTVEVVTKPAEQVGFAVQPKRWVVERTFAWLGRCRQLSKEYDRLPESTTAWIYLASINILLKRLASAA